MMARKRKSTPTRRIAIWPFKDPVSRNVSYTVLGPFLIPDMRAKRLSLSELIDLRDQADAQIKAEVGEGA